MQRTSYFVCIFFSLELDIIMECEDDIERLISAGFSSRRSSTTSFSLPSVKKTTAYRVLVMGDRMVGKTAIISQFMQDNLPPSYKATVQEMHQRDFKIKNRSVTLNIEDTGGSFAADFPAMFEMSLTAADAVILVYAIDDWDTFEAVAVLRDQVIRFRPDMPIVVVGNKIDLDRKDQDKSVAELVVECDWENGYVECSAKLNINIQEIFKEILKQAKVEVEQSPDREKAECCSSDISRLIVKRRQSLPANSFFLRQKENMQMTRKSGKDRRRSISSPNKEEPCKMS